MWTSLSLVVCSKKRPDNSTPIEKSVSSQTSEETLKMIQFMLHIYTSPQKKMPFSSFLILICPTFPHHQLSLRYLSPSSSLHFSPALLLFLCSPKPKNLAASRAQRKGESWKHTEHYCYVMGITVRTKASINKANC